MRQIWNNRLSREILLILIVKIVLIFAIWWVFFRAPETPTSEQVSHALLNSRPAIDHNKE
jgi:type II secretory pathway component PulM